MTFHTSDKQLIDLFLSNSGLDNIDMKDVESLDETASQNMLLYLDSQDTLELS